MPTRDEAIAALDAAPEHNAALPFLRTWAVSGDPPKIRHVLARLKIPVRPEPVQSPSLLTRAASFASAVVTHVAAGMPVVDEAEHQRRLAICGACPSFDAERVACQVCGCGVDLKARWADQHCPVGKW